MWFVMPLVLVGLFGLTEILYRDERRRVWSTQRTWRQIARTMPARDRREVGRAVRSGRPVGDVRLAPAAVALATAIVVNREARHALNWVAITVGLGWFCVPPVVAALDGRWTLALVAAIFPAFMIGVLLHTLRYEEGAETALVANRRLVEDPPPPRPAW